MMNSVARFTGLRIGLVGFPSTEVLGYFRIVRFADDISYGVRLTTGSIIGDTDNLGL